MGECKICSNEQFEVCHPHISTQVQKKGCCCCIAAIFRDIGMYITIPKLKLANGVLFIFHQEVITGFRAFSFSCPICKRKHGRQSPGVYQRNVLLFYFWFLLLFLPTSPVGRCNIINNFFGDVAELLSLPFCSLILYPILSPMRIRIQPFPHCEFGSKRCTLI